MVSVGDAVEIFNSPYSPPEVGMCHKVTEDSISVMKKFRCPGPKKVFVYKATDVRATSRKWWRSIDDYVYANEAGDFTPASIFHAIDHSADRNDRDCCMHQSNLWDKVDKEDGAPNCSECDKPADYECLSLGAFQYSSSACAKPLQFLKSLRSHQRAEPANAAPASTAKGTK